MRRICPAPECNTELVECIIDNKYVMYCKKCGGSKIHWEIEEDLVPDEGWSE